MTGILSEQLAELAVSLHALGRRLRQSARVEVARTIGEALREVALAVICGPLCYSSARPTARSAWDDPWHDPAADPWDSPRIFEPDIDAATDPSERSLILSPTLVAGWGAARWSYRRTRQIGPAILIGLLVALAACAGGPTVRTLLEAWSAATELLNFPGHDRRS